MSDDDIFAGTPEYDDGPTGATPTKDGYSASGTLFTQQAGPSVSCQKPYTDESDVYTVQFGITLPVVNGVIVGVRPQARISWSVADGTVTRLIDVGPGTSISGPAQAVKVALFDSTIAGPMGSAGTPYNCSIQIAKGCRPTNTAGPTLSGGFYGTTGGGSVGPLVIDQSAGIVSVMVTYGSGPGLAAPGAGIIQVVEDDGVNVTQTWFASQDHPEFVPLAPNTRRITINNVSASTNASVGVTYGIDG